MSPPKPKAKRTRRIDLRKQLKPLYTAAAKQVQVLDIPPMTFLMTDGTGDPNSQAFQNGIQTLYSLAYTVKFDYRTRRNLDFPVMALEGLWWVEGSPGRFDMNAREKWKWTAMIMQPEIVTLRDVTAAAEKAREKGKNLVPFRLESFREGLSAQILHIGPYSTEAATIEQIMRFIEQNGYAPNGKHHEIYLGDPRRTTPSRLRTILRQPVKQVSSLRP